MIQHQKKRKRNKKKNKVVGDILSAKVNEMVRGETVMDKAVTNKTTPEKKKIEVAGDILSGDSSTIWCYFSSICFGAGVLRGKAVVRAIVVLGELLQSLLFMCICGITASIQLIGKQLVLTNPVKKMEVAGDVLSTEVHGEGKGNAIEGLSAIDITESINCETILGKTALPDVKMVTHDVGLVVPMDIVPSCGLRDLLEALMLILPMQFGHLHSRCSGPAQNIQNSHFLYIACLFGFQIKRPVEILKEKNFVKL
ncbi:hypothetical protein Tco_1224855 [Tanacetum coccineum]